METWNTQHKVQQNVDLDLKGANGREDQIIWTQKNEK